MAYVKGGKRWILTGAGRDGAPVAGAMVLDVGDEHQVLLGRPWPFLHAVLVAARRPAHLSLSLSRFFALLTELEAEQIDGDEAPLLFPLTRAQCRAGTKKAAPYTTGSRERASDALTA